MKLTNVFFVLVGYILVACGTEIKDENERLTGKVDSLQTQLEYSQQAVESLVEIGELLDSIEDERDIINIDMLEGGISQEDYTKRIANLNEMLSAAEGELSELERSNAGSKRLIAQLRGEIAEKTKTIEFLEKVAETASEENITLKQAVVRQQDEITELETAIEDKRQELASLEETITVMAVEAKKSEADALYARAAAYEEAADRTKLAPKKKKETLMQALDLYKQSEALGHQGAAEKVKELEEKTS